MLNIWTSDALGDPETQKPSFLGSLGPDPKPAIQNLKTWDIFQFQK